MKKFLQIINNNLFKLFNSIKSFLKNRPCLKILFSLPIILALIGIIVALIPIVQTEIKNKDDEQSQKTTTSREETTLALNKSMATTIAIGNMPINDPQVTHSTLPEPTVSISKVELPQPTSYTSENGGKIVFAGYNIDKWYIYMTDTNGKIPEKLSDISGGDPSISPNGSMIVFAGKDNNDEVLYIMNLADKQTRIIYRNRKVGWPSWVNDNKIVFAAGDNEQTHIFMILPNGTELQQITTDVNVSDIAPSMAPDNQRLVFVRTESSISKLIVLNMSDDTLSEIPNVNDTRQDLWPSWSPDGQKIAFEAHGVDGERDIYTINPDGSQLYNVTNHASYDGAPVWSPDSQEIAFVSNRDDGLKIYIISKTGTDMHKLHDMYAWGPSWSKK